jgi:hypothetical protein
MQKQMILKCSLFFITVIILEIFFFHFYEHQFSSEKKCIIHDNNFSDFSFRMTGVKTSRFIEGELNSKFSADEINILPKKISIFNIQPFRELIISNATIEMYITYY